MTKLSHMLIVEIEPKLVTLELVLNVMYNGIVSNETNMTTVSYLFNGGSGLCSGLFSIWYSDIWTTISIAPHYFVHQSLRCLLSSFGLHPSDEANNHISFCWSFLVLNCANICWHFIKNIIKKYSNWKQIFKHYSIVFQGKISSSHISCSFLAICLFIGQQLPIVTHL